MISSELAIGMNHLAKRMTFSVIQRGHCHEKLVEMVKPVLARYPEKVTYSTGDITVVLDTPNKSASFSFGNADFFPAFTLSLDSPGPVDFGHMAYTMHIWYLEQIQDMLDMVYNAKELF